MCKVLMVAGIKQDKVPLVAKLAKQMAKQMSSTERDGVGYAAITKTGQIYGEKWLNKDDAFVVHSQTPVDPIVEQITDMFSDTIEFDQKPVTGKTYEAFGDRTPKAIQETVALILHARSATQGNKTVENVHPFVKEGGVDEPAATALIHNGSISNHDKLHKEMSDCDSEVILHEYLGNQMYHNPWGVEQLAKTLAGTYTVGVLSSQYVNDQWMPYLDIFKSNKELMGGYVPQLETFVYSTNKYTLEEALKICDMTLVNDFKFKDGYLHRIDAVTGQVTDKPISFQCSSQFSTHYSRQHENSSVAARRHGANDRGDSGSVTPYGPLQRNDDNVDTAKRYFERNHPSLFTESYLEADLTSEEKTFFAVMEKDQKTDKKALRLVSAALGMGA